MMGPYAPHYWTLIFCNVGVLQLFWFKKVRTSATWMFVTSFLVNLGMWLERFIIIPVSLHRDFLPSSWGMYHGDGWEWATLLGTFGQFLVFFLLFLRALPVISISELRELIHKSKREGET
jgi:molybdopterin-containing oxidoreductase family membrane subunit